MCAYSVFLSNGNCLSTGFAQSPVFFEIVYRCINGSKHCKTTPNQFFAQCKIKCQFCRDQDV